MSTNPGAPAHDSDTSLVEPRRAEVNALLAVGDHRGARQQLRAMPPSAWRDQQLARLSLDHVALIVFGLSLVFGLVVLWAVL